jgi:hypothetical protein
MDRRRFLQIAVGVPVIAAVPIGLAAEEPLRWRHVQQYTMNADELPIRPELDTQLRMSDVRECLQYSIVPDREYLRWDIRFLVNGQGKWHQYGAEAIWLPPYRESIANLREMALGVLQREFDRKKRIRANLLPLAIPRGMPTVESFLSFNA